MHATHTLPMNESELVTRRAITGSLAFVALVTFFPVSRARAANEAEAPGSFSRFTMNAGRLPLPGVFFLPL